MKKLKKPGRIRRRRHEVTRRLAPATTDVARMIEPRRNYRRNVPPPHASVQQGAPSQCAASGWLKLNRFCELSGYTAQAVYSKIKAGIWLEGEICWRSPDRRLHINWEAYQAWVRKEA